MWLSCYLQANNDIVSLLISESQTTKSLILPYIVVNSAWLWGTNQSTSFRIVSVSTSRLFKNYYCLVSNEANQTKNISNNAILTGTFATTTSLKPGKLHQNVNIYLNSQLLLFFDTVQLDDMAYAKENFIDNDITSMGRYLTTGGVFVNFDCTPIDKNQYKNFESKGLIMQNNEIVLMHQFTNAALVQPLVHVCFSILLRTVYYKNGQFYNMAL